jgi:hypothetical protein
LKKRTKKLLQIWLRPLRRGSAQDSKVFCFFFSKKKCFLPFAFNGLRLHYGQDGRFQLASASRTPAPVIITQPPLTPVPASVYPAIYALNGAFHVYALPVPTVK